MDRTGANDRLAHTKNKNKSTRIMRMLFFLFALNAADPNTTAYDSAQVVTVDSTHVVYSPMGDTQYYIWVRSICEDEDTHSKWFGPLKAKTPCGVSTFPYPRGRPGVHLHRS